MSKRVFLDAAKHVASSDDSAYFGTTGMCDAIQVVSTGKYGVRDIDAYNDIQRATHDWMHPRNGDIECKPYHSYWGNVWGRPLNAKLTKYNEWEYDEQEARECRILALCFMAAISEAGDL